MAAQRAGVRPATSRIGRSFNPGSTEARYSFTGTRKRRHDSTTDKIAATLGPACTLPMCSQFLRLCTGVHKRNYVRPLIMCSPPSLKAA